MCRGSVTTSIFMLHIWFSTWFEWFVLLCTCTHLADTLTLVLQDPFDHCDKKGEKVLASASVLQE